MVASDLVAWVAMAVVVVLGALSRLRPKRQPPSPVFTCARCGTASRHNNRTAEAWRDGKSRLCCRDRATA